MTPFIPLPDALTQPYWDGCKKHELRVQKCQSCGRMRHRPSAGCHWCGGREVEWVKISGRGTVYTYTVVHRAFHPAFGDDVPYVVGLVASEEDPAVRFHTRFVDAGPSDIDVDMQVEVVFEEQEDGVVIPFWRPVS